jgi:Leucine-rich repeat (LRR) protein
LDLSKNKFEIFPLEICRLENLQTLAANRNYFERIPDCIEYCSQLEELDLWDTPVVYFPATMQKLKKLKKLDLQGVRYNLKFQENLKMQLPGTIIQFDSPCDCMD